MVKLIAAKGNNNAIGKNNDLVWDLPDEMRFFTESTEGSIVIMGKKTWESIPLEDRPLSNRINAVITNNREFSHPDCTIFYSVEDAINYYKDKSNKEIFIIGGAQIYEYCITRDLIDEMFITFIHHSFEADTFFPQFDETGWHKELIMEFKSDEHNPYDFTVFKYSKTQIT